MDSSSKLFGDSPGREEWSELSLMIAQGLEQARTQWFQTLIDFFCGTTKDRIIEELQITVKHTTLSGEAAHATKAWQLYLVSNFLAHHRYIPPSEGRDFADLLYAQVCGTELSNCLSFLARYDEVTGDRSTQLGRFGLDISRYITGQDAPLMESLLVASTLPQFTVVIHLVVAAAFADSKTVSELQAKLSAPA